MVEAVEAVAVVGGGGHGHGHGGRGGRGHGNIGHGGGGHGGGGGGGGGHGGGGQKPPWASHSVFWIAPNPPSIDCPAATGEENKSGMENMLRSANK